MSQRLFGTDGVRGVAGDLLTAELALALGRAAARHSGAGRPRVLIVRDTRESGEMLQAALAAGVCAAGGEALLAGVLPTPAAPLLLRSYGFDMAAVISASHNPYQDNGVKFFAADGFKLSDEQEAAIEADLADGPPQLADGPKLADGSRRTGGRPPAIGAMRDLRASHEDYLRALEARFSELRLDGRDILLDCANGATYRVAPEIFRRLGANVTAMAAAPDGRNINAGCGSTHVDALGEAVRAGGHELAFAFDGDGDRVLAVDRDGTVVDGDELIALTALHLREQGRLAGDGVVVTVMTNYGFHAAMREAGIEVACTSVGDRYVIEELRRRGYVLGGEQSGHIVDMSVNSTGDGIASALLALEALGDRDLADRGAMRKLPQRLVNVRVADRSALERAEGVGEAVRAEDAALAGRGRVLVRPSGTEPLVRVMVEAPSDEEADAVCSRLVAVVERELG